MVISTRAFGDGLPLPNETKWPALMTPSASAMRGATLLPSWERLATPGIDIAQIWVRGLRACARLKINSNPTFGAVVLYSRADARDPSPAFVERMHHALRASPTTRLRQGSGGQARKSSEAAKQRRRRGEGNGSAAPGDVSRLPGSLV